MASSSTAGPFVAAAADSAAKAFDVVNFMDSLYGEEVTPHGAGGDHSAHGAHSHGASGAHAHGGHEGHVMKMWFHGGYEEVILFDCWRIESCWGLFFSCVAIFIMGAMYEGIKWFRVHLQMTQNQADRLPKETGVELMKVNGHDDKAPLHRGCGSSGDDNIYNPTTTPPTPTVRSHVRRSSPFSSNAPCSPARLLQASLYIIQLILAYWLMLVVMTYNSWLTAAVILGAGFGHWLFAVLKISNPQGDSAVSFATDACH